MIDDARPPAEVFISYKKEDRNRVLKIHAELEMRGVSTWMDVFGIVGGDGQATIAHAIRSCKVLLLVLTQEAVRSSWVQREVAGADLAGIPVIPLRLDQGVAIPDELYLALARPQYIDLVDEPAERWLPKVLEVLERHKVRVQRAPCVIGSLPPVLTDYFQGRTDELSRLSRRLGEPMIRLVVLSGRQGVGKTALVAKLVHDLSVRAVYLAMKEAASLDTLANLLSETLPQPEAAQWLEKWRDQSPLGDKFDFFFRRLATERCWIVLDDFENALANQLVAPAVVTLIEACIRNDHSARIIAVSNEVPRLSAQLEANIVTRTAHFTLDQGLDDAEGIALLRACDADDRVGFRNYSDELLAGLVRRCSGYPELLKNLIGFLISELSVTLREIIEDEETFARFRNHPARAVYDNLTAAEREVVGAFAVYDAPVSKEAVRYLLGRLPTEEIGILLRRYVLDRLKDCFALHPQYQPYAYEQISDRDRRAWHSRAAQWFADHCKAPGMIETLADVEAYSSRHHHLIRAGRASEAEQLLYDAEQAMEQHGFAGRVVAMRSELADVLTDEKQRGRNFRCAGLAQSAMGEHQQALVLHAQSLSIARAISDPIMEAKALISMGFANNELGYFQEALGQLTSARSFAAEEDLGGLIGNLGDTKLNLGQIEEGIALTRQALELHSGNPWNRAVWLGNLGVAHLHLGQIGEAIRYFKEALEIEQQHGFVQRQRIELSRLGRAFLDDGNGDILNSQRHYDEANALAARIDDKPAQSRALFGLGRVYHAKCELGKARQHYEDALAIGVEKTSHHCRNRLGLLHLQERRPGESLEHFDRAVEICTRLWERGGGFDPLYQRAFAHLGRNASDAALADYQLALKQCRARGVVTTTLRDLRLLQTALDTPAVREALAGVGASLFTFPTSGSRRHHENGTFS